MLKFKKQLLVSLSCIVILIGATAACDESGPGWRPAQQISETFGRGNVQNLTVDDAGSFVLKWTQRVGGMGTVESGMYARIDPAGVKSTPVDVFGESKLAGYKGIFSKVAGDGTIFHLGRGPDKSEFAVIRETSDGGREEPVFLENSGRYSRIKMEVSGAGNAIIVWMQDWNIFSVRYVKGQGWLPTEQVKLAEQRFLMSFNMSVNQAGLGFIFWREKTDGKTRLHVKKLDIDKGWADGYTTIAEGDHLNTYGVDGAVGDNGDAILTWMQTYPEGRQSWTALYRGGVWSQPEALEPLTNQEPGEHRMAMDAEGNAIVAWIRRSEAESQLVTRRNEVLAGWLPETVMGKVAFRGYILFGIERDYAGNFYLAYVFPEDPEEEIYSNRIYIRTFAKGKDWTGQKTLVKQDAPISDWPNLKAARSGVVSLVWTQGQDSSSVWGMQFR